MEPLSILGPTLKRWSIYSHNDVTTNGSCKLYIYALTCSSSICNFSYLTLPYLWKWYARTLCNCFVIVLVSALQRLLRYVVSTTFTIWCLMSACFTSITPLNSCNASSCRVVNLVASILFAVIWTICLDEMIVDKVLLKYCCTWLVKGPTQGSHWPHLLNLMRRKQHLLWLYLWSLIVFHMLNHHESLSIPWIESML